MLIRHMPRTVRTLMLVTGMTMLTVASALERYEHEHDTAQLDSPVRCESVKDPRLDLAFMPS